MPLPCSVSQLSSTRTRGSKNSSSSPTRTMDTTLQVSMSQDSRTCLFHQRVRFDLLRFDSIRFDSEHALSSYLVLSCLVSTSCGDELLYIPSILNIVYCTRTTTLHILIHFCYYSLSFIHSFIQNEETHKDPIHQSRSK